MQQVGLTGGIGTGKSVVAKIFRILRIPIFDADLEAKGILVSDPQVKAQLIQAFGSQTYTQDGQVNRAHLASLAFQNNSLNQKINSIVHPAVREAYIHWCHAQQEQGYSFVINEAALLYEAERDKHMDKVIVVDASIELRIQRIRLRDPQRSDEEIRAIMERQMPQQEKVAKADFVIHNDQAHLLIPQVIQIHQALSGKL